MEKYTARIVHSEETVKTMAMAQYNAYRPMAYYVMFAVSLLLLAVGVSVHSLPNGVKILCLVLGSFTVVSLNAPAKQLGEQVNKSLRGRYPRFEYRFGSDSVQLTGSEPSAVLRYGEIVKLYEERDYLYLFIQNHSAYMIELSSVKPDAEGLKKLLSEKTGLAWTKKRSVLNTSLKTLRESAGGKSSGPRL